MPDRGGAPGAMAPACDTRNAVELQFLDGAQGFHDGYTQTRLYTVSSLTTKAADHRENERGEGRKNKSGRRKEGGR